MLHRFRHFLLVYYKLFQQRKGSVRYSGNYDSWDLAQKSCEGYDSAAIFDKVCKSALKIVNAGACYDRDSVLFYEKKANYPLVMWLLLIGKDIGTFNILDYGGDGQYIFPKYRFSNKWWIESTVVY